jgi:hypothetical protein
MMAGTPADSEGACFDFQQVYAPSFEDGACWSMGTGLSIASFIGGSVQGAEPASIARSKFVGLKTGVRIMNPGSLPGGVSIVSNHLNCSQRGIVVGGKDGVFLSDNLMYHGKNSSERRYADVELSGTASARVVRNVFHFPGSDDRTAVRLEGGSTGTLIRENLFNQPGTGISIGPGVRGTRILDNRFFKKDEFTGDPLNAQEIVDRGEGTVVRKLPEEAP